MLLQFRICFYIDNNSVQYQSIPLKSFFSCESKVPLVVLSRMTFYGGEFLFELVLNCHIFVGSEALEYYRGYLVPL